MGRDRYSMGRGVDIPWVGGLYTMGRGVDMPSIGGKYTMVRGSIYYG